MQSFRLGIGHHPQGPSGGVGCVNEIASVLAGEKWSDNASCVDQFCREMAIAYNDSFDDDDELNADEYTQGLPWRLVGTASEKQGKARRKMLAEFYESYSDDYSPETHCDILSSERIGSLAGRLIVTATTRPDARRCLEEMLALTEIKEPACQDVCLVGAAGNEGPNI